MNSLDISEPDLSEEEGNNNEFDNDQGGKFKSLVYQFSIVIYSNVKLLMYLTNGNKPKSLFYLICIQFSTCEARHLKQVIVSTIYG